MKDSFGKDESWLILSKIEQSIKKKVEDKGVPLKNWNIQIYRGILTGYNKAFIINEKQKNKLIEEDPKSAEIIRPILRGRDIKRYEYTFSGLWLINVHNGIKAQNLPPINIEDYPAIKDYLDNYYPQLAKRADKGDTPYNLRNCVYMNEFFKPKIAFREISNAMDACLVDPGIMLNNKCYLITGEHLKYILSYLNSSIFTKIILPQANATGGKGADFLGTIPLIPPSYEIEQQVLQIYKKRSVDPNQADKDIDHLFCNLYRLTPEEYQFIQD